MDVWSDLLLLHHQTYWMEERRWRTFWAESSRAIRRRTVAGTTWEIHPLLLLLFWKMKLVQQTCGAVPAAAGEQQEVLRHLSAAAVVPAAAVAADVSPRQTRTCHRRGRTHPPERKPQWQRWASWAARRRRTRRRRSSRRGEGSGGMRRWRKVCCWSCWGRRYRWACWICSAGRARSSCAGASWLMVVSQGCLCFCVRVSVCVTSTD